MNIDEKSLKKGFKPADVILEELRAIYDERGRQYKANYTLIGDVLENLFPNGVHLRTAEDHNKWHLYLMALVKATRLANTGLQHKDSALDMALYTAMLAGFCK